MPNESAAAAKAIREALKADATLVALVGGASTPRIYSFEAARDVADNYIIYSPLSSRDDQGIGTKRQMTEPLYQIHFVCRDNPYSATAQTAAKRIDEVIGKLTSVNVTDANGDVYQVSARREGGSEPKFEKDKITNISYYRVGGNYRLAVSAA